LLAIFGKDAQGILTGSGDPIEDKNLVERFLKSYDQMHRFSRGPDDKLFLILGAENADAHSAREGFQRLVF
jgi:hypothetical protein